MPEQVRTRRVSATQARSYLAKAEELLEAARESLDGGRSIAATSLAVHAGINAGDAIAGARMGQRAAGGDHQQAAKLLEQAGREGKQAATLLRRLLPLKNRAEYDPDDIPKGTARKAAASAEKLVARAHTVIESLP